MEQTLYFIKQVIIKLITVCFKISLMDLHQNMSINSWWWDENILNGCMYHVFRQYTLLWCLRIEERPRVITMFDSTLRVQEQDVTVLNGQWSLPVLNATVMLATNLHTQYRNQGLRFWFKRYHLVLSRNTTFLKLHSAHGMAPSRAHKVSLKYHIREISSIRSPYDPRTRITAN